MIGHEGRRALLLEAELRVLMNVAAPSDHLGHHRWQFAFDELGQLGWGGGLGRGGRRNDSERGRTGRETEQTHRDSVRGERAAGARRVLRSKLRVSGFRR